MRKITNQEEKRISKSFSTTHYRYEDFKNNCSQFDIKEIIIKVEARPKNYKITNNCSSAIDNLIYKFNEEVKKRRK